MAVQGSPIIGFIHVCMINEFFEIFKEQADIIRRSGLYDACQKINICCAGEEKEKLRIEALIKDWTKFRILAFTSDIKQYEYLTLKELKKAADLSDFYGFYVHSKGVTWPGHEGGRHWRDYMNFYNLEKWDLNVRMLNLGYETCGVKMITRPWPHHYSGNFFWFKSSYVRTLQPVQKLNVGDRFQAEFWICSGRPVAATLCQRYIDYSAKGKFDPNEKGKIC